MTIEQIYERICLIMNKSDYHLIRLDDERILDYVADLYKPIVQLSLKQKYGVSVYFKDGGISFKLEPDCDGDGGDMHKRIIQGPPAFARTAVGSASSDRAQTGMSLRDYFAGQALCGLASRMKTYTNENMVMVSYELADEMIKQRTGQGV